MAGIYKRGATYWGRAQRDGKEFRRSLQTRSESVAKRRLAQWLDDLEAASWGEKPRLTLNQVADQFIQDHLPNIRIRSAQRYGVSLTHLDAHLGHLMLDAISSADLVAFETARRSEGVRPSTVRRDLACLSSLMSFAIEREIIEHNPVGPFLKRAKKRGLREGAARTRYLKRDEEARLLTAAVPGRTSPTAKPNRRRTAGPRNDMMLRAAIVVAIYSGMRLEEQFGLTWRDVDLPAGLVRIPEDRAKGRRARDVVLLAPAIETLRTLPRHIKSPYLFWHRDGARFRHLDRGFKAAAKRAKVADVQWHDLRRTHGCRLLQEHNWTMTMVRDQLGHSSVVVTEKAYAFLELEHRQARAGNRAADESEAPDGKTAQGRGSSTDTRGTG